MIKPLLKGILKGLQLLWKHTKRDDWYAIFDLGVVIGQILPFIIMISISVAIIVVYVVDYFP